MPTVTLQSAKISPHCWSHTRISIRIDSRRAHWYIHIFARVTPRAFGKFGAISKPNDLRFNSRACREKNTGYYATPKLYFSPLRRDYEPRVKRAPVPWYSHYARKHNTRRYCERRSRRVPVCILKIGLLGLAVTRSITRRCARPSVPWDRLRFAQSMWVLRAASRIPSSPLPDGPSEISSLSLSLLFTAMCAKKLLVRSEGANGCA